MAQAYEDKFIGIIRATTSANFEAFTASGTEIVEQTNATTLLNQLIVEQSDGNHQIYNETTLTTDANNTHIFDETAPSPPSGDFTYLNTFVALVKDKGATVFTVFTGSSTTVEFSNDKSTFLATLRQDFGDGKFRIFQQLVQAHTHTFTLVP